VVVPPSLRQAVLRFFHEFHPGIIRMRQLMRQFVWWPGMDGDIQKLISQCDPCAKSQQSRVNYSLSAWPESSKFFQRLFIDLFFFDDKSFLILIDQFSNFVDIHPLKQLSSNQIISALQKTFCYFGLPDIIAYDNGKQFVSKEFKSYLSSCNIDLMLTPTLTPSNGKAERAIRTAKLFLSKNLAEMVSVEFCLHQFCIVNNFFPSSNGTIPSTEYMKHSPKVLMRKALLSNKQGITEVAIPQTQIGTTIVSISGGRLAHNGGVFHEEARSRRVRQPNSRYFNKNFVN